MKEIKTRIRSVSNIRELTKAMEMVSASKMRRSQEFALKARPYAVAGLELLDKMLGSFFEKPYLMSKNEANSFLLVIVSSDKGLAGALNLNIFKKALAWLEQNKDKKIDLVCVGKKAKEFFSYRGYKDFKSFTDFGDFIYYQDTSPVSDFILKEFLSKRWREVWVVYPNFRTTLKQEAVIRKILPLGKDSIREIVEGILPERGKFAEMEAVQPSNLPFSYEYLFEPSVEEIIDELLAHLVKMIFHHIILESNASEHSSRMVAMRTASENADEIQKELTLAFNKSRQAKITNEILEVATTY